MTEQTLQDRLRRAKLVEEYNDQMFDEAADCIDELQAEVAQLKAALEGAAMIAVKKTHSARLRSCTEDMALRALREVAQEIRASVKSAQ
jgi:hypothetical protein